MIEQTMQVLIYSILPYNIQNTVEFHKPFAIILIIRKCITSLIAIFKNIQSAHTRAL